MTLATFPINIYSTRRTFGDCGADDMQYGDISAERLQHEFNLTHISNVVDPFTMTRLTPFHNPQSRFAGLHSNQPREKLTAEECASLLFAELQATSLPFSMVGSQRFLINRLLDHLKRSSGMPFRDSMLDRAYYDQIVNDRSDASSLRKIKAKLDEEFRKKLTITPQLLSDISVVIGRTTLPKFDSLIKDKINGLGISVHDIHSTKIDFMNIEFNNSDWKATIRYQGQDHFGLDKNDITKDKFRQFQFFKIWFVLQRYEVFGYRPFLTNMEATIDITGSSS